MKLITIIRLDSGDAANPKMLEDALGLVGGREELTEEEQKFFGRIRGNDFTLEDAEEAVAIITRRRTTLHVRAAHDQVFEDPKVQNTFSEGVKANSNRAVELAEDFLRTLKLDILHLTSMELTRLPAYPEVEEAR